MKLYSRTSFIKIGKLVGYHPRMCICRPNIVHRWSHFSMWRITCS